MSDLLMAVSAIRAHADDYQRALDYYTGDVPEVFASDAVKRALRGQVAGFDINLARRPVDAVLDRMRINAVSVPGDEAATNRLTDEVWSPNRMDRLTKRVHRHALAQGDAYVTVWPDDEGRARVHFNSARTTRVFYSDENDQVKEYAARLWTEGSGTARVYRADLYYADRVESYATLPGREGDTEADWQEHDDGSGVWPLPNPFGTIPVFHFRTDEPYGRPVHRGAFGPQNAITKLSATLMSTIDYQGFPQRYKLLNPPTGTDAAVQTFDFGDDDTDHPEESASGLQSGPGTIWDLDAKAVGEFSPANVEAFLDPLRFYARAMATATATPLRFFEPSGDVPSGESLRADDAPLAHRIADVEEILGECWQEVLAFAALVNGAALPEVDIQWAPVQTVDDQVGWQTALLKQQAGVPTRQVLTEAGYDGDLVDGWMQDSDRASLDQRIASLSEIGKALQALGAASALGVVDQATVQLIVAQTMGDLVRDGADVPPAPVPVLEQPLDVVGEPA